MEKYCEIKNTDLRLSRIGLGAVNAGTVWDEPTGQKIMERYLELGGNVIDTARIYSDWIPGEIGRSERVIGDWIRTRGHHDDFVLITKGGHPLMDRMQDSRMKKADMEYDLELSLKALGVDCVDIYFYHRDDLAQPVEELVEVMQDFVRQGKIRYYSCSNWTTERMAEAEQYCKQKGYRGFILNEMFYNMASDHMNPPADETLCVMDEKMKAFHRTSSIEAMPYSGICGGFFHRLKTAGEEAVKDSHYYTPGNLKVAQKIDQLCEKYQASITQVLLGFYLCQDFPAFPLTGVRYVEQLDDVMGTLEIPFKSSDFEF